MKTFLVIASLFITTYFFGQQRYTFDYLIQYEYKRTEDSKPELLYLLTNSNDNSYRVSLKVEDNEMFNLYFRHETFRSFSTVEQQPFFNAETINLSCESIHFQKDKVDLKRFDFMNNKDTLIANQTYKNYAMQFHKNRDSRNYKKGRSYYIVENGTEFHKPLLIFSSLFDVTATSEIFPNGIAKEMYNTSKYGVKSHFKLVKYTKVNKTIIIPDCSKLKP